MITPVIKFSDIKKDPSMLVVEKHAAIVRYGTVVAYVVTPDRMAELLNYEEDAKLAEIADERADQKRISVDLENL